MKGWSHGTGQRHGACHAHIPSTRCIFVVQCELPVTHYPHQGRFVPEDHRGKVSLIVKMVTTPRENISMLIFYFDISLLDLAGAKDSGGM